MLAPFSENSRFIKYSDAESQKGKRARRKVMKSESFSYPKNFPDDEVSRAAALKIFAPIYYSTKHVVAVPKFIEVFKYFAKVVSNVMKT